MNILAGMTQGITAGSSLSTSINKMIADCVHKLELSAKRYSKDSVKLGIDYIDCEIGAYALDVYFRPIVEGSHKSKDLTYVISINTFYEESMQFTLWTASYSNPRNVRSVKKMGDLDYSEYTAYDVYKVLFTSDLNKKSLRHPYSTGGFSKAFYTFYEKRLYPSLGGDDKLGKMLSSRHNFSRRGRSRMTASEYEYDIIRAISDAIGSKYGELDIITHSDKSGGRHPHPEVSFTLVGGDGGAYRVILTAKKKGRSILFEVVGGYESAPSSRNKTLYKVNMGNPMWLSGEYLADELVGWADDKKLWKGGKIQRDFKNLRWRLVEECEYLLEDGEDEDDD